MKVLAYLLVVFQLILESLQKDVKASSIVKRRLHEIQNSVYSHHIANHKRILQGRCMDVVFGRNSYVDWCASCRVCNSTSSNGTKVSVINCQPCSNYSYQSGNISVVSIKVDNYSTPEGYQTEFYSDCDFWHGDKSQCKWRARCVKDRWDEFRCDNPLSNSSDSQISDIKYQNRIFTNSSRYTSDINANCTIETGKYRNGSTAFNITCQPDRFYNSITGNRNVVRRTEWNSDSLTYYDEVFTTDCFGSVYSDSCWWIASCARTNNSSIGYDCKVYEGQTTSRDTKYISNGSMFAKCEQVNQTTRNNETTNTLNCKPDDNYINFTTNTNINKSVQYDGRSDDKKLILFKLDCTIRQSLYSDCNWIVGCFKSYSSWLGYQCEVYNESNPNQPSPYKTQPLLTLQNYSSETKKYLFAECTPTHFSTWKGVLSSNVSCVPKNYSYESYDTAIHRESSTVFYTNQTIEVFRTDCWGNQWNDECKWISKCRKQNDSTYGRWDCLLYGNSNQNTSGSNSTRIFSNYTWPKGYLYANCSTANFIIWNGSIEKSIYCKPVSNYSSLTSNTSVSVRVFNNWSSPDGRTSVFSSDCWGSDSREECYWITTCYRDFSYFGFDCRIYYNNQSQNSTNNTRSQLFSNWSNNVLLTANCTVTYSRLSNGSNQSNLTCAPSKDYRSVTGDTWVRHRSIYNWSSIDGTSQVYSTDCYGDYLKDECNFIASCSPEYYGVIAYDCIVYRKNSSNQTVCTWNIISDWKNSDWCANCTVCNYSLWNGSRDQNLTCRPCRNYSYDTSDYSVHLQQKTNMSSYDSIERVYTSDCRDNGECGWCATGVKTWRGDFNVTSCQTNSSSQNLSRNTFKYQLAYGIDWCANCTVNNSRYGGCQPCSAWAPYTNISCEWNISIVQLPGLKWCSNCTTCTNNFQFCQPCRDFVQGDKSLSAGVSEREVRKYQTEEKMNGAFWPTAEELKEMDAEKASMQQNEQK